MSNDGILLESGTNEVELLEFELDGQGFGVNVLKIQAIEQYNEQNITKIQLSHPSVVGTLSFRDTVVTLINLGVELGVESGINSRSIICDGNVDIPEQVLEIPDEQASPAAESDIETIEEAVDEVIGADPELVPIETCIGDTDEETPVDNDELDTRIVLVMEFNSLTTAFLVDGVNRIHRVSWDDINPLSPFLNECSSQFTGSIQIQDREILIVDMEHIVNTILLSQGQQFQVEANLDHPLAEKRSGIKVLLAEDSGMIRETVEKELNKGNYSDLTTFANGQDAFNYILEIKNQADAEGKDITEFIDILVSDIEMPLMDGLTLCRRFKTDLGISNIPVIIFSSLINKQIAKKCESVQADAWITKPQFTELVTLLDKHVFGEKACVE